MTFHAATDLVDQQGPIDRDKRWVCPECGTENNVGEAYPCGNESN
jgi:hypothetical protein